MLNNKQKYNIVINNDNSYDGEFIYAIKTTKIFCRPSCPSKKPLEKNVVYFNNANEALTYGYRPCKRCRPDLIEYKPELDMIKIVKKIIIDNLEDDNLIYKKINDQGISLSLINRVLKHNENSTLPKIIVNTRINKAKELLLNDKINVLSILNQVGFKSSASFYRNFKLIEQITPTEFRKNNLK